MLPAQPEDFANAVERHERDLAHERDSRAGLRTRCSSGSARYADSLIVHFVGLDGAQRGGREPPPIDRPGETATHDVQLPVDGGFTDIIRALLFPPLNVEGRHVIDRQIADGR